MKGSNSRKPSAGDEDEALERMALPEDLYWLEPDKEERQRSLQDLFDAIDAPDAEIQAHAESLKEATDEFLRELLQEEEEELAARLAPLERSRNALEVLGEVVPARINEEEIGDAMERIHRMAATGKPIWRIYLATAAAIWWVLWHTVLHEAQRVAGIVSVALGKGDDK